MCDTRKALPEGTLLELLSTGSIFEISGEPLGYGGGSIIYPARRMIRQGDELCADGIYYALKECYPASDGQDYYRSDTGEIIARNPEYCCSLEKAKERHLAEKERNQNIHMKADRMLPILEAADEVALTLPGTDRVLVSNAVSVMESLANKGRSLSDCLVERRRFSARETCRILQQLLFALRDVHKSGHLHLDIQGGNVFLRGTLEDKSDFVTLIDFGSARPVQSDNKTEPIRDREIFTSRGFSAPEMILNNTGTLRLGAEADLYTVGCIALYLLTGQRPNQNQLLANRSGKYLKPNQLRLVDCPVHLQDQLQELLANALAKDPEDRFGSADEMLEKVDALLEALQPKKSALGAMTYDAFICYKHGPLDSPAAKALQQRLERFHTTDNAGKRIRPFRKVFVDEGELSACADFGQQIHDALENSRWLLVICSEDTAQSPWVKLEIETFLQIHGQAARSRILTVLTSGEPNVSIIPELMVQSAGVREPFAADIRGETPRQILKNLKGDAFLRLAAAMLDRPFDALKQRQKVYFLQNVAMVTGVCLLAAMAFAAYAVNRSNLIAAQAVRIQEEYENALINESMLLAEQAQKQLQNNNPLEAMALALNALPSAEQDRPVVTEAEYVLGKALGIYQSPNGAVDTVTAVSTIDTDDNRFFLDDTGTFLFTWKSSENGIEVWDAENLTPVRELIPQQQIIYTSEKLLIPELTSLIIRDYRRIFSVNYITGEENWSYDTERILAVRLSEDRSKVVLLSEQEAETGEKKPQLEILFAETGVHERRIPFQLEPQHEVEMALVLSPDLRWAAVPAMNPDEYYQNMYPWHALYLIDLEDGSCRKMLDTDTEILNLRFLEGRLAVLRATGYTFTTTHGNALYQYTEPICAKIETYDPASGSLFWGAETRFYLRDSSIDDLSLVSYDTGTVTGKGLLALSSDTCVLLDWDSGQTVRQYELQSSALDIRHYSNGFETLNADGSSTSTSYTLDTLVNIPYFDDSVSAVCCHGNNYYIQSTPVFSEDYSIRKYERGKYDDTYTQLFEANAKYSAYYDLCNTGNGIRLVMADENQVSFMDSADGRVLTHEIPVEYEFSSYRITGSSQDAQRIYWKGSLDYDVSWITNCTMWVTDLLTGETRKLPVPEQPEPYMTVMDYLYFEESLWFSAMISRKGGFDLAVYRWNLSEGSLQELKRYELADAEDPEDEEKKYYWEDYLYRSFQLDEEARQLSFATVTNGLNNPRNLIRLNLAGEETARITPEFKLLEDTAKWNRYCYQWSPDGTRATIGYGGYVYLFGADGGQRFHVPAPGYAPVVWFLPDGESLLVFTEDLMLRQYRSDDGLFLTGIDLAAYTGAAYIPAEDMQLVGIDETAAVLFTGREGILLDTSKDAVKVKAVVDDGVGYDPQLDCFLVAEDASYNGDPAAVGTFHRYQLEDLLRKANAILAGAR